MAQWNLQLPYGTDLSTFAGGRSGGSTIYAPGGATDLRGVSQVRGSAYDEDQYYYDEGLGELYEILTSLGFNYAEMQAARDEFARQFDEELAFRYYQADSIARSGVQQASIGAGATQFAALEATRRAEIEAANALRIAELNNATQRYIADKEFEIRLKEILSNERISAADIWSQPIDYLAYNRWMLDYNAMTTESGLPVGAPGWHTGEPEVATVGTGDVATGGVDVYGQALAEGQRIPAFNAWAGPTTPVEGTPWVSPHQVNVEQFSLMPQQAQEMAFARWRRRGIVPESAQQAMLAAAPTGTAQAVGYG